MFYFNLINTFYNRFKFFSGIIDENKIKNYTNHRNELVTKCNSASFVNAIQQLEEYMSDRLVYKHFAIKNLIEI